MKWLRLVCCVAVTMCIMSSCGSTMSNSSIPNSNQEVDSQTQDESASSGGNTVIPNEAPVTPVTVNLSAESVVVSEFQMTAAPIGFFNDENSNGSDFGESIAFSSDGSILAVGQPYHNSDGRVLVYQYNGSSWELIGELAGSEYSAFGRSIALSDDGRLLAVGSSSFSENLDTTGKVLFYEYNGSSWELVSSITGSGNEQLGSTVALSSDGTVVAIFSSGFVYNDLQSVGKVSIYQWPDDPSANSWVQIGSDIHGSQAYEYLGTVLDISSNGDMIAVGAPYYYGESNNSGLARVYRLNGDDWVQVGSDFLGQNEYDTLGRSVSLSADGTILAIGSPNSTDLVNSSGVVSVYYLESGEWILKGSPLSGEERSDSFGYAVDLSADGLTLAIGVSNDFSNGSFRFYKWNDSKDAWDNMGLAIQGDNYNDYFGLNVILSSESQRVAVWAPAYSSRSYLRIYDLAESELETSMTKVTATLSSSVDYDVLINLASDHDEYVLDDDYELSSSSVLIQSGQTSSYVWFKVLNDQINVQNASIPLRIDSVFVSVHDVTDSSQSASAEVMVPLRD